MQRASHVGRRDDDRVGSFVGIGICVKVTVLLPMGVNSLLGIGEIETIRLTARPIDADRALEIGLVNRIVPPEALLDEALAMADAIAANAPLAVRETRRGVRELLGMSLPEAYVRQEELGRPLRATRDAHEAQRAFVEKRVPTFEGH